MTARLLRDSVYYVSYPSYMPFRARKEYMDGTAFHMTIKSVLKKIIPKELFRERKNSNSSLTAGLPVIRDSKKIPAMVHGKAGVRDGKVVITDPQNDGSYATIVVPSNPMIAVFVNGKQEHGEVVLTQSQRVDVKFSSVEPSVTYEAIVSDSEMNVTVQAKVTKGVKLSLRDCEPSRHLVLTVEETYTVPESSPPSVVLSMLSDKGYSGIVDYVAVNRLCNAVGTQEEAVLRGIAPKDGREGKSRASANFRAERDEMFRTNMCATVSIGTTVAVFEPEIEGVPGKNVYGAIIAPTKTIHIRPSLGHGVINVDGNIVAVRDGRLKYTKHVIDVIPELVFHRDISKDDGDIHFDGNVIVRGSIADGSVVRASGTVTVYGVIQKSNIFGEKGIYVSEGIYESNVVSGHQQIIYKNLLSLLGKMILELKRFEEEYSAMMSHAIKRFDAYVTIPKIPSLLFENRHANLDQMLGMFVDNYSKELTEFDSSYRALKELVEFRWRGVHRFKVSQKDIELLFEKIVAFNKEIKSSPKELSIVKAANITSSSIRSVGNILVTGSCRSSTLESENTVSIRKNLCGGFVVASKSVYVSELGNPAGVESSVRVTHPNGFIDVELRHQNTLLEVNGRRSYSYNSERSVRFRG